MAEPPARLVLPLSDPASWVQSAVGAKAANLARCAAAGLPTVDGFVVTTEAARRGFSDEVVEAALYEAWKRLGDDDERLAVRSSSTVEDGAESSMAGQFLTVLDVTGWLDFRSAVESVVRSADRSDVGVTGASMAVLVQPQLDVRLGGVLFGADPVSGAADRWVVEVVPLRPDDLVSGRAVPLHLEIDDDGSVLSRCGDDPPIGLDPELLGELLDLGRRCCDIFGGPQDIEWAVEGDGTLRLLQCRPCTALADPPSERTFVTGPVAETFPSALRPLEIDLWVAPFRDGVRRALDRIGSIEHERLQRSPVIVVVGGRVAIEEWSRDDADSAERRTGRADFLRRRLRATALAPIQAVRVRRRLGSFLGSTSVPLRRSVSALLADLTKSRALLAELHELEVCAGTLVIGGRCGGTASGSALRHLGRGRANGLGQAEIVERWPVVLTLVPPSLNAAVHLPVVAERSSGGWNRKAPLSLRERLKVWIRLMQNRQRLIVEQMGGHLASQGMLESAARIGELTLGELRSSCGGEPPAAAVRSSRSPSAPLPARFRLTAGGDVVATEASPSAHPGIGASAGRVEGVVSYGHDPHPDEPVVLVVEHLTPDLAATLPSLTALVSETGGVLSHLAILARELSVPTVVAVPDARRRFPEGSWVLVDGRSGEVEVLTDPGSRP